MLCIRQGIECVAEQLVASEEGLFCMTLIVVHCYDFDGYYVGNIQRSNSVIGYEGIAYHSSL